MKIHISDEAAEWYMEEMDLHEGDFLRFFVRYGGHSTVQQGFSLGLSIEEPTHIGVETIKNGITYYIEEKDLWYFDGHDFHIAFNEKFHEPEYQFPN
ncbi:HesB/YadR/YfhF family protein [Bacillus sp. Bva_UNVM-123]|uniref:HesB/YadR/YfhF family protein n=1 Tax=Bacillus sp. Bva_UNVM-123 TaxID=2829798 RepID=UPI00391F33F3